MGMTAREKEQERKDTEAKQKADAELEKQTRPAAEKSAAQK